MKTLITHTQHHLLWLSIPVLAFVLIAGLSVIQSCKKNDNNMNMNGQNNEIVTDIDGNVYHTVTIGTQVWMVENLKTTRYRWGGYIYIPSHFYNDDPDIGNTYGRLYDGRTADSPGVAPTGWHVPSTAEFETLVNYLGGQFKCGGKLMEAGTAHWGSHNTYATNSSGFTALPGGYHRYDSFEELGVSAYFWTKTTEGYDYVYARYLCVMMGPYSGLLHAKFPKGYWCSIRCIKD